MVAAFLWICVSAGFSFYVANFGNYNQVYGSIGAVIAMLVWIWISSFIVLYGAALNAQIELRTRADSASGTLSPMVEHGVFVAETVVAKDAAEARSVTR